MHNNKYSAALVVIVLIPVLAFLSSKYASSFISKYLSSAADMSLYGAVVSMTDTNKETLEILKAGNFEFRNVSFMDNVSAAKLSKYFGKSKGPEVIQAELPIRVIGELLPPKERVYRLDSIYIGDKKQYAIIDGELYKVGDIIADKDKLTAIENNRVRIKTVGGSKWLTLEN